MNDFVKTKNGKFSLNDKVFKFIGSNMYELANVDSQTTAKMLFDAANEGFNVVRFWAFEPMPESKLTEICDICNSLDLHLIPVLADPSGYLQSYKIEKDWYSIGFKENYLRYVSRIAEVFRNRKEILLWEIINEPSTESFGDIFNFAKIISATLKRIDPDHLVSIGTIGGIGDKFGDNFSRFKISNFEKLYLIETLDAVSLHDYSFNSTILERLDILFRLKGNLTNSKITSFLESIINFFPEEIDKLTLDYFQKTYDIPFTLRSIWRFYNNKNIEISERLNKPVYIGEVGFKKDTGKRRLVILEKELRNYLGKDITGIILWSFESQGRSKDGHDYGFDHSDGFGTIVKKIMHEMTPE